MDANPANLNPLSITKKNDFLLSPPSGWRLDSSTGKMKCEDNSVTLMTTDNKFAGGDTCMEVSDLSELESARELVFSKPIVTVGRCYKPYREHHSGRGEVREDIHSSIEDYYVMIVNTRHPQVTALFNEAFEKAESYIKQGKIFRVTIKLSESLRVYYINEVHAPNEQNNATQAMLCDLYISHGVGRPSCGDMWFGCHNSVQTCIWIVCFPICLVTGVPFQIYKKCVKGVRESESKQALPVLYHPGPIQFGFNLFNLMYPPGTVLTTFTHTTQPAPNQGLPEQGYTPHGYAPQGYPPQPWQGQTYPAAAPY